MFNKTLSRPMFRRGGRAGGGIMTGVDRQGYDGTDGQQTVVENDPIKDTSLVQQVKDQVEMRESIMPKYPYKGSDFFMGLGANILSQPGGQPILQTLGTAAKEPLNLMMKQNIAEYGNKRDIINKVFDNLSDDDKILTQKQVEFFMSEEGGGMTKAQALEQVLFRKSQSPSDRARNEEIREEKLTSDSVANIQNQYKLGEPDAVKLQIFQKDLISDLNSEEKKYKLPYDGDQYYIENDDVTRFPDNNKLIIKDYNPEQSDYLDGTIYLDFKTNTVFVKQGQFFIPYTDYISETIQTD
jgi:hypothetical protein